MKKTKTILFLTSMVLIVLSSCKAKNKEMSEEKTSPDEWPEVLYDGNGMDNWNKYLTAPWSYFEENGYKITDPIDRAKHLGWNHDPYDVFTEIEENGEKMIRISGEVYGALISKQDFENYHLSLVFKWGKLKWPPRLEMNLDCGLLYHSIGDPGMGHNSWMRSNEFQIEEGHCGDYYTVAGMMNTITAIPDPASRFYIYSPDGEEVTFGGDNWWCKVPKNFENPAGEWNTLDLYTFGGKSMHVVNGHLVMTLLDSRHKNEKGREEAVTSGKIQIQSEGAEVFIKNIDIKKINGLPEL